MGKKLPRRTMSMAKRANATAEAATELDLVEGAIGTEEENAERFTSGQLILGWLGALAIMAILLFVASRLINTGDGAYTMLPDGYREQVGLGVDNDPAYQGNGRSGLPSAPRSSSPFPDPQGEMPIILKVTCPDGTVEIATGEGVADTVCVRGRLVQESPPTSTPVAQRIIIVSVKTETSTATDTPTPTPAVLPASLPDAGSGSGR